MTERPCGRAGKLATAWLAATALIAIHSHAKAQDVVHLSITQPGGMPGLPVITGVEVLSNGVYVTWDGPSGYYQLFEKPSRQFPTWQPLGPDTNLVRNALVPLRYSNAVFSVSGPQPHYGSFQRCEECHYPIVSKETRTAHQSAFANSRFVADGGHTKAECLACHTVGDGLPTGFVSETITPLLAAVECENCHGPAGNHAANPDDPAVRPRVELAATVCGGCHTDPWHPTYDEWQTSAHSTMVIDANPADRIDSCGRCHSGSARLSLLLGTPLPYGDADVPVVCAVCHDPHQTNANPAQLRNPTFSTNNYSITTEGTLASQYNPKINICGQCHNDRGASWTNSAAPPHPSAQYNLLVGSAGELESGLAPYQPGAHALLITNQCAGCHMQSTPFQSAAVPAVTGHAFQVQSYVLCQRCHSEPEPLVQFTMGAISNRIEQLKGYLDLWASTKAPGSLWTNYGDLAWEYTMPGGLSSGAGKAGPNAAEQTLIPVNIQKARFNLYLVFNEGSFGVHNGPFISGLLDAAEDWIDQELSP